MAMIENKKPVHRFVDAHFVSGGIAYNVRLFEEAGCDRGFPHPA